MGAPAYAIPEDFDVEAAVRRTEEATVLLIEDRLRPPPELNVSDWSDEFRVLPDTSARPGPWRTDEAPYLRGVMDACSDPTVERVVFVKPSQVGGTECINNVLGYFIHQDPAPILVVQYSIEEAHKWSKERFAKMVDSTPALGERIAPPRSRDSGNTILSKSFPGGHLGVVGANAPSGLSARPRRVVLIDEVDRFPPSAGTEGDPVELAVKRTRTFFNRLVFLNSSPGHADTSRIWEAYQETDQCQFYVPCPACRGWQVLRWENLVWEKREGVEGAAKHRPETVRYGCSHCGELIHERHKRKMVQAGEWRPTNQDGIPGYRGFQMSALPALWVKWEDLVREWVAATTPEPNPELLQVFVNTSLGEPWEAKGVGMDYEDLVRLAEDYDADPLPEGVCVITAGVDVQDDRLEVELVGWGVGMESWSLDYLIIRGDPSTHEVWDVQLHNALSRVFQHPLGPRIRISCSGVDSGYMTQQVLRFTKPREAARVYAFKGSSELGKPIISRPGRRNKLKAPVHMIGTDAVKTLLYQRLQLELPGPGRCHFPNRYPEEYFRQLTAEQMRRRKNRKGHVVREWVVKKGRRNEALDCRVYAHAAMEALIQSGLDLQAVHDHIRALATQDPVGPPPQRPGGKRRVLSRGVSA